MSEQTVRYGFNCDVCQMWWHKADHCPQCAGETKGRVEYKEGVVVIPPQDEPRNGHAAPAPSIHTIAANLISNDRHEAYGDYNVEAPLVAAGWEALRRGGPITPTLVPLMMIWLKMVRESHKPKADNRVDISGYLQLLDQLHSKP